jgi:hypothetical protein
MQAVGAKSGAVTRSRLLTRSDLLCRGLDAIWPNESMISASSCATHVLAGPRSTRSLAEYGAEVLHVSSPAYPDRQIRAELVSIYEISLELRYADPESLQHSVSKLLIIRQLNQDSPHRRTLSLLQYIQAFTKISVTVRHSYGTVLSRSRFPSLGPSLPPSWLQPHVCMAFRIAPLKIQRR